MPVERIRVLIANIPDMLSEILVSQLGDDREIEVLISKEESELLPSIGRFHPNVVIAGCSDAMASCAAHPPQVLYVLSPGVSSARRIELHPVSEEMGDVSLSLLVAIIKARREH